MSQRGKNEMDCGDLKESGSHSLLWSGAIKKYGLVGVGVALLEWVWPCWRKCVTIQAGFEVSDIICMAHSLSLLPVDQDVALWVLS